MAIATAITFLFVVHLYVHFSILCKCSFNDFIKVSGAILGLFVVMAFVSAIPVLNSDIADSDGSFSYLFTRSGIEEISKIIFGYVLFENLPREKIKHCTLTFCLILSFYEMFPVVYPLYIAAAEYWTNAFLLYLPYSQLLIAEVEAILGATGSAFYIVYNILRIYLHYKLTIFGIEWLLRKSWWCLLPVVVHGLANVIVLAVDIQVTDENAKLYLYTLSAVCWCALLHTVNKYLRSNYCEKKIEQKRMKRSMTKKRIFI